MNVTASVGLPATARHSTAASCLQLALPLVAGGVLRFSGPAAGLLASCLQLSAPQSGLNFQKRRHKYCTSTTTANIVSREIEMKGANGAGAVVVARRTLMAHVLAVAATALVLLWCIHFRGGLALRSHQKQLIFNVHPVLMVIGVIVIGGEAVLTYRSLPAWVSPQARKKAHLALHALGLAVGILGVYAVFKFHVESRIPNLYTLHSWIGIATITLYAIQWLAGFLAFFYPGAAPATRRSVVPWHAVLGLLVFALAVGNAQLGFLEKLTFMQQATARTPALVGKYGAEALLVNFTAIVVLLLGVAVVLATVNIDASRYTAM